MQGGWGLGHSSGLALIQDAAERQYKRAGAASQGKATAQAGVRPAWQACHAKSGGGQKNTMKRVTLRHVTCRWGRATPLPPGSTLAALLRRARHWRPKRDKDPLRPTHLRPGGRAHGDMAE